jgi:hypothetical protein
VGGTLPLSCEPRDERRVRNASLVFAPTGERVARYDKIHLFRFNDGERQYDEAAVLAAGSRPVVFELPSRDGHAWRVGLSVCYDLRFPELYRAYAAQGADLLLVPSAFTHVTGRAHWELLLRARGRKPGAVVPPPRAACTRTAGAPGATPWWSMPGARCWPSGPRARAWCWPSWTPPRCAPGASNCRHWSTGGCEPRTPGAARARGGGACWRCGGAGGCGWRWCW